MSVLNRQANPSKEREKTDWYETKQAFANAHVNSIWPYMSRYADDKYQALDLGFGTGVYGNALREIQKHTDEDLVIHGIDINLELLPVEHNYQQIHEGDFLDYDFGFEKGFDLIIGNPPYLGVIEFVNHSLNLLNRGGICSFLLKTSFLETKGRFELFKRCRPMLITMLVNRPIAKHAESYCLVTWQNDYYDGFDRNSTFTDWMYVTQKGYERI